MREVVRGNSSNLQPRGQRYYLKDIAPGGGTQRSPIVVETGPPAISGAGNQSQAKPARHLSPFPGLLNTSLSRLEEDVQTLPAIRDFDEGLAFLFYLLLPNHFRPEAFIESP